MEDVKRMLVVSSMARKIQRKEQFITEIHYFKYGPSFSSCMLFITLGFDLEGSNLPIPSLGRIQKDS